MDNLPNGMALDPDTFGIVVNTQETKKDEWTEKADTLMTPLNLTLNMPAEQVHRLKRMSEDAAMTLEQYLLKVIGTHMSTAVAKPMISGPSNLSGQQTSTKRITGPTYSVTRG